MLVWLFQTGEPVHADSDNDRAMRAINLTNALLDQGCEVVIWTSNFYHQKKIFRYKSHTSIKWNEKLTINYIHSCGYKRNISIARFFDHALMAFNLWRQLNKSKRLPDKAFVGYPPVDFAYIASSYLKKNKIPFVVDCKDLWPDLLIDKFPGYSRIFGEIIFSPYIFMGRKLFRCATAVSSMSAGYLNWIKEFSNLPSSVLREIFPLTSVLNSLPNGDLTKIPPSKLKEFNPRDIIFIGSLTESFNFDPIINAATLSAKEGKSWRFIICGDGPESEMLKHRCSRLNNVEFKGWVDQSAIDKISVNCFAFVAPYKRILNFELNIPNKISDYLSRGKPVFTSLFGEVRTLISEGGCGVGYDDQITGSLFNEIENLAQNLSRYEEMCGNAKRLYDESFDGRVVYGKLAKFILNLH